MKLAITLNGVGKTFALFLIVFFITIFSYSQNNRTTNSLPASTLTDFNVGAAVIDMGISPQTENNGLRPYGLVYELVNNLNIPVYWVIKDGKSFTDPNNKQDDTDLLVNGTTTRLGGTSTGIKELKAGPFVIPAEFIDDAYAKIEEWQFNNPGLTVYWNLEAINNAPVRGIITTFPNTVIYPVGGDINDTDETDIEIGFYNRAGIEESSGIFRKGAPEDITTCDQFYVLSHHTDPEELWDQNDVNILYDFVQGGGNVWMGCHDVSISESLTTSGKPHPSLNFLSTTGLMPYEDTGDHAPIYEFVGPVHSNTFDNDEVLYDSSTASDDIMQFIGEIHPSLNGNSEHIYLPRLTGNWRATTQIGFYDPTQIDVVNGNSNGRAAVIAYGPAYGDPTYGNILYNASHISKDNSGGDKEDWVGEGRLFGNFLIQSALETAPEISIPDFPNPPMIVCSGDQLDLLAVIDSAPTGVQTYLWESEVLSGPGTNVTFTPDNTSLATTINVPNVTDTTVYKITFTLTVTPGGCSNPVTAKYITTMTVAPPECSVHIDGCPSDIEVCYDGDGGTPVDWTPPTASYECCDDDINASFVVEFDLPESSGVCWNYSRVQRIGSNNLRLFQSGGGSEVSFTPPLQYFNNTNGTPVTMELIVPSGVFDWTLQVLDGANVINSQTITGISGSGDQTITIPNTVPNGAYKLKFLFDDNGTGINASNHIEVDRLYYNAILIDDCADGLNFVTTSTHNPGDEFPIGNTQVTYTATLTFSGNNGPGPIVETCTFNVEVIEVEAPVSSGDIAECAIDPIQTLNANDAITVNQGLSVVWYDAEINGNEIQNPILDSIGSETYWAEAVDTSNCSSVRTSVTLTLFAAPNVDAGDYGPLCDNVSPIILTGIPTNSNGTWNGTGVSDNGDGTASFDPTGLSGTITVTYSYSDNNNCSSSDTADIEINTSPTIDVQASNETVECDGSGNQQDLTDWLASSGGATASSSCGGITWSYSPDPAVISDLCGATGSVTVTFTATDSCGCISSDTTTATFTIEDTAPPTASDPDPITVECISDIPDPDINVVLDANDECGSTSVTHIGDVSDNDLCEPTITRTYRITDSCDLSTDVTQLIIVDLTIGP
ncbi:MAG: HYR domain-containing protein, partial [Flavobacteriaceae bacterium]|nr:HYR domain-containing protein [Flavobacteriaceae bacterium]